MNWRGLSVFGLMLAALSLMMLVPAARSAALGDTDVAGVFLMGALITSVGAGLLLLATWQRPSPSEAASEFGLLIAALTLVPLAAAVPVAAAAPFLPFEAAYFEMVSSFTTTGATVFERPNEVHPAIHLWRGMTGWAGGFIALVMAFSVLAPRNLGGFEVRAERGRVGAIGRLRGDPVWAGGRGREAAADRIASAVHAVAPVYAGLTAALVLLLISAGEPPERAIIHAMSVLSTSGISPVSDPAFSMGGIGSECIVVVFLVLASTRLTYGLGGQRHLRFGEMRADPEMRILFVIISLATLWLFMRHWVGALELEDTEAVAALRALWGAFFTVLSFATTTGFVSDDWQAARVWSGLDNTALILFGLAIMGGGVATTAGGVKLLRAYALFKHGAREMERLVRPSSISGTGEGKRGIRREGAQIAWVFVMLFLIALAFTMAAFSLAGLVFEEAVAASVATLTNTGPIYAVSIEEGGWLTSVTPAGRIVAVVAMILGRVELLALIALLNVANWR